MIKRILIVVLVVLVGIQFFHPQKNISTTAPVNGIAQHFAVPENVQGILKKSCYDCHSNNTVYPWYNNVQPVAWWLANHVKEGKHDLNFDEFAGYAPKEQYHKLEELINSQREKWMPLNTYLWIHKDAILDQQQKDTLIAWADSLARDIKTKNNLPEETEKKD